MKAVILAGGKGSRLEGLAENVHKSMIPINGKPILEYQIDALTRKGVKDICICVGHQKESILDKIPVNFKGANITFIDDYKKVDTLFGLYLTIDYFKGHETLVVNGDLIFDENLIDLFVKDKEKPMVFYDSGNFSEKEPGLLIKDGKCQKVVPREMTKNSNGIISGIWVFNKETSYALADSLIHDVEKEKKQNIWFVYSVNPLFEKYHFYPVDIKGLKWAEIDDKEDLERAIKMFS